MFPVNTDHVTILQYYACLWLVNPFLASRPFVLGPLAPRYGDMPHRVSVLKWVQGTQSRISEAMPELPGALVGAPEAFRQNIQTDDP